MLDRLIVEVPDDPWIIVRVVGFALIVKSGDGGCMTLTETLAEWVRVPLVPVTVAVYDPTVELLRVQVDDPEPLDMLAGLQLTLSPDVGLVEVVKVTVPVKPFWLVRVVVKLPVVPALNETLDGVAEMVKSGVDWCSRQAVKGCISQPL